MPPRGRGRASTRDRLAPVMQVAPAPGRSRGLGKSTARRLRGRAPARRVAHARGRGRRGRRVGLGLRVRLGGPAHPAHRGGSAVAASRTGSRRTSARIVSPEPSRILIRGHDGAGRRYYLAGRPVHAGTRLELLLSRGRWLPIRFPPGPGVQPARCGQPGRALGGDPHALRDHLRAARGRVAALARRAAADRLIHVDRPATFTGSGRRRTGLGGVLVAYVLPARCAPASLPSPVLRHPRMASVVESDVGAQPAHVTGRSTRAPAGRPPLYRAGDVRARDARGPRQRGLRREPGAHAARCATSCARGSRRARGRRRERVERHRARGKLPVRERIERLLDPDTPFLELSPLAAYGLYDDDAPGAGHRDRHRPVHGPRVLIVANDATVKGGTLLPDDGQEAPARAGDRAREPPALRLPRRLGRRVPAAAGRGLPRSRSLRAHLLQPGAHVGATASRRSPP